MSTPPAIRSIPAAYDAGEQAEYAAIRSGCAIDRIAPRALLEVAGDEPSAALLRALRFRLFDPGPADVRAAIILDGERITAAATVVRRAPDRLLMDCSNPTAETPARGGGRRPAGARRPARAHAAARPRPRGRAGRRAPAAGALRTDFAPGGASTLLCGTGADRATIYCGRDGARACWDSLVAPARCRSARPRSRRCASRTPSRAWSATSRSRCPCAGRHGRVRPDRRRPGAGRDRARGAVAAGAGEAARRRGRGGRAPRRRPLRASARAARSRWRRSTARWRRRGPR